MSHTDVPKAEENELLSELTVKQKKAYAAIKRRTQEFRAKKLEELGGKPDTVINGGEGRGLHISGHRGALSCQPPVAFSRWLLTHPEMSPLMRRTIVKPGADRVLEGGKKRTCVLDIAGGKGQLAQTLQFLYRIETIVLDPRSLDCRKQLRHHLAINSLPSGFEIASNDFPNFFNAPDIPVMDQSISILSRPDNLLDPSPMLSSFRKTHTKDVYCIPLGPRTRLRRAQRLWRHHVMKGYKRLEKIDHPPDASSSVVYRASTIEDFEKKGFTSECLHQQISASLIEEKAAPRWVWIGIEGEGTEAIEQKVEIKEGSHSEDSYITCKTASSNEELQVGVRRKAREAISGEQDDTEVPTKLPSISHCSDSDCKDDGDGSSHGIFPMRLSKKEYLKLKKEKAEKESSKANAGSKSFGYFFEESTNTWFRLRNPISAGQEGSQIEEWYNLTWRKHDDECFYQQALNSEIRLLMGKYWDAFESEVPSADGLEQRHEFWGPVVSGKLVICLIPDYRKWSAETNDKDGTGEEE